MGSGKRKIEPNRSVMASIVAELMEKLER